MIYIKELSESGNPCILIGETGCGKTTLIEFLCHNILNERLKCFKIHSCTNIKILASKIIKEINLAEKNPRKIFNLFFDEFNTSSNMAFFKKLFSEKQISGIKLPSNIKLFAACNPYRFTLPWENCKVCNCSGLEISYLNKYFKRETKSTYLVEIISPSLELYLINFGPLMDEDEEKYIKEIIQELNDENLMQKDLFEKVCKIIKKIHAFFKMEKNDYTSTSLRDISRFKILYKFFLKYESNMSKYPLNRGQTSKESDIKRSSKHGNCSFDSGNFILGIMET